MITEKSESCTAQILSKISCKIGDHFVNAYINTGSSISIASTDLYRKLADEKCLFKEGKGTLHEIDDSIPNQEYHITSTVVKVIGKTKLINLVAFPNMFIKKTTLGIDFLTTKSKTKSNGDEVFLVPEIPKRKAVVRSKGNNDENNSVTLLDWMLNSNNLNKPLYNILADETAEDEDLFAICAIMKRLPRPVSPLRRLKKPAKKLVGMELAKTSKEKTPIAPVTSTTTSNDNVS